jgi:peptide chain release factor subunit 1
MATKQEQEDSQVEMFKIKRLIKSLQQARGDGTSMISLIIPPGSQVAQVNKMLGDEYGTASNIKSRVNRLSVLGAITSTQQKLKLYSKCPKNGLVIYCGTVKTVDGKSKRLNIDFEPFKPINTSLYLCDNKFHTEALGELLEDDSKFGFVIMDGNGCLYATLCGNHREILHKFSVDLPKKHGRGGQSALRFARLRLEKRRNYVRKVAELCSQLYIDSSGGDVHINVSGLILAGSAAFKQNLLESPIFDARLKKLVLKTVDVSYGGENGLNQAIELAADTLGNVKFIQEKRMISDYFNEISQDTGKYCFGVADTFKGLDLGAVELLLVWEDLEVTRFKLRNPSTEEEEVIFLKPEEMSDGRHFKDSETGVEFEVLERESLIEWLANNYKKFGTRLEFITNKSQEGSQFVRGFGGIGGVLRWRVDFVQLEEWDEAGGDYDGSFDDEDFM